MPQHLIGGERQCSGLKTTCMVKVHLWYATVRIITPVSQRCTVVSITTELVGQIIDMPWSEAAFFNSQQLFS